MKIIVFAVLLCGALASESDLTETKTTATGEQLDQIAATLKQILLRLDKEEGKTAEFDHKFDDLKSSRAEDGKDKKSAIGVQVLSGEKLNDTDLEQRVQILEVQVAEVQNGVGILEADQIMQDQKILDTQVDVSLLSTGLLTTQEAVSGLEDTVVALDSKLDAQELGGALAFHVAITPNLPDIPTYSVVVFNKVEINLGEGYNSQTGEFTVPSGGAGLYYFYAHFVFDTSDVALLYIRHNTRYLCGAFEDNTNSADYGGSSCGAVVQLYEGDIVDVYVNEGDGTPINGDYNNQFNRSTFSGFRIAPA